MRSLICSLAIAAIAAIAIPVCPVQGQTPSSPNAEDWLDPEKVGRDRLPALSEIFAADDRKDEDFTSLEPEPEKDDGSRKSGQPAKKGPPLPFHCIEGYSGGAITPMAYICNCGPDEHSIGRPAVSYSLMAMTSKELHVFVITQSFLKRFEIGYGLNHLRLGSLYDDVKKGGGDPGRKDLELHHVNLRANLLPENSFDLPTPAVTAGVHFKYNDGIKSINRKLGGAFSAIGYARHYGFDYTLMAGKTFPKLAIGRPVMLSGGMRISRAAQLGLLGFGDRDEVTFEGSVATLPTNWLCLGYEFRQKENPYKKIPGLIGDERNWHALSVSWIVTERLTISGLYGALGNVANANEDKTLGVQIKWEF